MNAFTLPALAVLLSLALAPAEAAPVSAEQLREQANVPEAVALEGVTVTATAQPTASLEVPAAIALISGGELRARGVSDLRTAMLLVAGVSAAAGGDAGPLGSQPILRGSSETDDYLLIVDGVPLGGAFNPATAQVDFNNVQQLEVLRGPSPVLYGAISFAGVLRIDHYPAGKADGHAQAFVSSHGGRGLQMAAALPALGSLRHSITATGERVASASHGSHGDRPHTLYRAAAPLAGGELQLDLDASALSQRPASPALFDEEGEQLSRNNANFQPADARLADRRFALSLGYVRALPSGTVHFTFSAADGLAHHRRGVLEVDAAEAGNTVNAEQLVEAYNAERAEDLAELAGNDDGSGLNGEGFLQRRHLTDAYADLHFNQRLGPQVTLTTGIDALFGDAQQRSEAFDYRLGNDGSRPSTAGIEPETITLLGVTRRYGGVYSEAQWQASAHGRLTAGLRYNRTLETRRLSSLDVEDGDIEASRDSRSASRLSGLLGYSQQLWHDDGGSDVVLGYANYRHTFKPADVDFGADAEGRILAPQSGQSVELGVKGKGLENRLSFDANLFLSRVKNVVIQDEAAGSLTNAGEEGFSGAELEARLLLATRLSLFADYSYTRARYRRLDLGGESFAGKRLELTAEHEGALGLLYSRREGLLASVSLRAVGARFLDRNNAAELDAYLSVDASLGWNTGRYSLQLIGQNLSDRREPVGRTEFGEDQYYLLPARSLRLALRAGF